MRIEQAKRLKDLEKENARLKKLGKMTFHYIARGRTIGWLGE